MQIDRDVAQTSVDRRVIGPIAIVVGVSLITDFTVRGEAEVSVHEVCRGQRHRMTTLALTIDVRARAVIGHLHTVITRRQVLEPVETVDVRQRRRQHKPRRATVAALVQGYFCARDARLIRIGHAVLIVVDVDKVTNLHQRREAKVGGVDLVSGNRSALTTDAFLSFIVARVLHQHTVRTVRHFFELVETIDVRGHRPQRRAQRAQVSRTRTAVQRHFHERHRRIASVKVCAVVPVDVDLITNAAHRRKAEVSVHFRAACDHNRFPGAAFQSLTKARILRNHTVGAVFDDIEQVLTRRIGRRLTQFRAQCAQVQRTSTCVQVNNHPVQSLIASVKDRVAVVVDVSQITDRTQRHEPKVRRQRLIVVHRNRHTTSTGIDAEGVVIVGNHTVITRRQLTEQVLTVGVRRRGLQRRVEVVQIARTGASIKRHRHVRQRNLTTVEVSVIVGINIGQITNRTR